MARYGLSALSGLLLGLVVLIPPALARPSFSCDGRLNDTESAICSDDELAALDVRLHNAYTRFMRTQTGADRGGNRDVQINWQQERNACGSDTDCIRDAYNRRLEEIASYSRPAPRDPVPRPTLARPSFSCDGRLNDTESAICSDDELAALDVRLHNAYTRFMRTQTGADRGGNRDVQINWQQERNACGSDTDCIRDAYNRRIAEIISYTNPPQDDPPSLPSRRPPRGTDMLSLVYLEHNNSTIEMRTDANNNIVMRYSAVRPGLAVMEGTVLFRGTVDAKGFYYGKAYVFKSGCAAAEYTVTGEDSSSDRIVLGGPAPVYDPNSCEVAYYDAENHNARLVFNVIR